MQPRRGRQRRRGGGVRPSRSPIRNDGTDRGQCESTTRFCTAAVDGGFAGRKTGGRARLGDVERGRLREFRKHKQQEKKEDTIVERVIDAPEQFERGNGQHGHQQHGWRCRRVRPCTATASRRTGLITIGYRHQWRRTWQVWATKRQGQQKASWEQQHDRKWLRSEGACSLSEWWRSQEHR